jgi:hypothetical protein
MAVSPSWLDDPASVLVTGRLRRLQLIYTPAEGTSPGMRLVTMIALGFPESKANPKKPLDLEPYVKYIS